MTATGKRDNVTPRVRARFSHAISVLQQERYEVNEELGSIESADMAAGMRDLAADLDEAIKLLEAHGADARTREIDRVICDHGHVSDQVRDLQRAVLLLADTIARVSAAEPMPPTEKMLAEALREARLLVAHEVGRHSGDPIEWVPKRESPFRASEADE